MDNQYPTQAIYFTIPVIYLKTATKHFFAFDESLQTGFRHPCPNHKINRELLDEGLAFQLNARRQLVSRIGTPKAQPLQADDLWGLWRNRLETPVCNQ